MINQILSDLIEIIKKELFKDVSNKINNACEITLRKFMQENNIYIHADFVAGYVYYEGRDYILLNQYDFPYLSEIAKKNVLFHECMHLISTKKYGKENKKHDVGFVFRKLNFININEGLNEIASGYLYNKIYNDKYKFVKAYNLDRQLCNYLVDNIYEDKKEFLKDYIYEKPYSFYKKIFYYFNLNNLLEFKNAIDNIYREYKKGYNLDNAIRKFITLR